MKNRIIVFLLIGLCLLLAACSEEESNLSGAEVQSSLNSAVESLSSSVPSEPASVVENNSGVISEAQIDPAHKFSLSRTALVDNLNAKLSESDYAEIAETDDAQPKTIDGVGDVNYYVYDEGDGFQITLCVDPADDNLVQIMYTYDKIKGTEKGIKKYDYCIGITEAGMAGGHAETVDQTLNLDNISEPGTTLASTEKSLFTYIVNEDVLIFMVMPND